jgi:hypothetical protein
LKCPYLSLSLSSSYLKGRGSKGDAKKLQADETEVSKMSSIKGLFLPSAWDPGSDQQAMRAPTTKTAFMELLRERRHTEV